MVNTTLSARLEVVKARSRHLLNGVAADLLVCSLISLPASAPVLILSFTMASETVKKVQERLFRSGTKDTDDKAPSESRADAGLSIQIPKPDMTPPNAPTPPPKPKLAKSSDSAAEADGERQTYRDRLIEKLGHDYKGVERYRLEQDEKKDRHWKRWGPYLSDRQWVRVTVVLIRASED